MTISGGRGRDRVYLESVPREEAQVRYMAAWAESGGPRELPHETVGVADGRGRVLARAAWARRSNPHYSGCAMDGIAVRSRDTVTARETAPLVLQRGQDFVWVDTGNPVPGGFDSVIMVEDTHELPSGAVEITSPASPWQHVRPVGEDVVRGDLVLPAGTALSPADQGALLAAGVTSVVTWAAPRVVIIPTGDELVPADGEEMRPGDIPEFNSTLLRGLLEEAGAEVQVGPITPDDPKVLRGRIETALTGADMVLVIAGSSAGRRDHTARVTRELGQVVVHGVAIRPGGPAVLGLVGDRPVIGIPGYPVSAAVACELFAVPLVHRMLRREPPRKARVQARLSRRVASAAGREEYLRVHLARVGEGWVAAPTSRGAGNIKSLSEADGLMVIPRGSEGCEGGSEIEVELLRPAAVLERSLVLAGSSDMTLDVLKDLLALEDSPHRLVTSRVGSLGGLVALRRGEAHMAGSHLLDPESGTYNITYVKRYLPQREVHLVHLMRREQGLIVRRGNPLGIEDVGDLVRREVNFMNRQRGAGTRVLLDYELARLGIDATEITGYEREVFAHTSAAQAVASGAADVSMGIRAAAVALDVDFVPVTREEYHLVIPSQHRNLGSVELLLDIIVGPDFRRRVLELGGYDCSNTGEETVLQT